MFIHFLCPIAFLAGLWKTNYQWSNLPFMDSRTNSGRTGLGNPSIVIVSRILSWNRQSMKNTWRKHEEISIPYFTSTLLTLLHLPARNPQLDPKKSGWKSIRHHSSILLHCCGRIHSRGIYTCNEATALWWAPRVFHDFSLRLKRDLRYQKALGTAFGNCSLSESKHDCSILL